MLTEYCLSVLNWYSWLIQNSILPFWLFSLVSGIFLAFLADLAIDFARVKRRYQTTVEAFHGYDVLRHINAFKPYLAQYLRTFHIKDERFISNEDYYGFTAVIMFMIYFVLWLLSCLIMAPEVAGSRDPFALTPSTFFVLGSSMLVAGGLIHLLAILSYNTAVFSKAQMIKGARALRQFSQSRQKRQEALRQVNGDALAEEFAKLHAEVAKKMGDSPLLSGLKTYVDTLVKTELPKYLKLRAYLIENIPIVRATVERKDLHETEEAKRSKEILKQLEQKLATIETSIARMRAALHHMIPVIVQARAGMASESAMAEETMAQLREITEAVQSSIVEEPSVLALPAPQEVIPESVALPVADRQRTH